MIVRIACGICVAQVSVTRSLAASHAACAARGSIGKRILPVRADVDFDPPVRARQLRVEAGRFHPPFDHDVSGRLVMDERSAGSQRRVGVDDRRHVFDLDLHAIGDVLGLLLRRCDHRRDRLADEAHHRRRPAPAG